MRVMVTGAFGNVGTSAVEALVRSGQKVRCFDLETRVNQKAARRFARRYGERVEVVWGDLRKAEDVTRAVCDQDVVVHLAFIIPKLSATGVDFGRAARLGQGGQRGGHAQPDRRDEGASSAAASGVHVIAARLRPHTAPTPTQDDLRRRLSDRELL